MMEIKISETSCIGQSGMESNRKQISYMGGECGME